MEYNNNNSDLKLPAFHINFTDGIESYKITFKNSNDVIKLGKYFSKLMDDLEIEHQVEQFSI